MKKNLTFIVMLITVLLPIAAATDGEILDGMEQVLRVFDLVVSDDYKSIPGADLSMDLRYGLSFLDLDDMDVSSFLAKAEILKKIGDENFSFTAISGNMAIMRNFFDIEVQLEGGRVNTFALKVEAGEVNYFKADGKDCLFLAQDPEFLKMIEYTSGYFARYYL
jgi:hypothetical protein